MSIEDKEIKIRAVMDSESFDKSVDTIKKRLQKLSQEANQMSSAQSQLGGKDTVLGKYAQQAFGDFSKESQRELEKMFQTQRREAINQKITMREKQQEIEKLAKIDGELTKQQKQRLDFLQKEMDLLKEKHKITLQQASEVKKTMDEISPDAGGGVAGAAGAAGGPMGRFGGFLRNMLSQIGPLALAGGVLNTVNVAAQDIYSRDRAITQRQGAALQPLGRDIAAQFQGRGSEAMFFGRERSEAMRMAAEEAGGADILTGLGTLRNTAIAAGGGALVGGPLGMLIGGIAGFGGTMFGSERARSQIFDRERFRSMVSQEGMQNFESNLAAIKARDPRAMLAQQYFSGNAENIANLQTTLGVGDTGLLGGKLSAQEASEIAQKISGRPNAALARQLMQESETGGVLQTGIQSGLGFGGVRFDEATIRKQIGEIVGAGGTTEAGRELGGFGAALERQMGMQGGGALLGRLSGAGLGVRQTEDAAKRLMAEAVKMGVDTSTMPREMERMVQMTAELATAGGGFAQGAVEASMAGIMGFDTKSIEGARSAADMFKRAGKAAGGFEGQMGLGFLQGEEAEGLIGRSLSATEQNFLNQFSFTEARQEDFQRIADYLGTSPENARELLRRKDLFKQTRTETEQETLGELGQFLKDQGAQSPEDIQEAIGSGEGAKLFTRAQEMMTASRGGFGQLPQNQQRARIMQLARLSTPGLELPEGMEAVETELGREEDRAAFIEKGSRGVGDLARIKALNDNLDRLKDAAKAHTENAEIFNEQFQVFIEAMKKGSTGMEEIAQSLEDTAAKMYENQLMSVKPQGN